MTLSRYAYLILLVLSILLLLITAFKGLFFPDEGYIVNSAQRILDGQVLYRDFDFVYTPLTAYATSLAFFLGGSSILSERIFNLLISLGTGFALVKIGQRLSSHPIL